MTVLMNYSALIYIALFCKNNCIFVSSSALSIAQVWRSHEDVLRPIPCILFVCCYIKYTHIQDTCLLRPIPCLLFLCCYVTYTHIQHACPGPGIAIVHPMSCVKCGYHPWGRQVVLSQQTCFMLNKHALCYMPFLEVCSIVKTPVIAVGTNHIKSASSNGFMSLVASDLNTKLFRFTRRFLTALRLQRMEGL